MVSLSEPSPVSARRIVILGLFLMVFGFELLWLSFGHSIRGWLAIASVTLVSVFFYCMRNQVEILDDRRILLKKSGMYWFILAALVFILLGWAGDSGFAFGLFLFVDGLAHLAIALYAFTTVDKPDSA
jgi:hypothetical protein